MPGSFGVEQTSKLVRIVWHYRATDERRTFTIKYRFRRLAVVYDDVVDVNLRVWGDEWKAPLGSLNARMELPRAAALGPAYRVWGSPAWVRGVVDELPRAATLQAANVPADSSSSSAVAFHEASSRPPAARRFAGETGCQDPGRRARLAAGLRPRPRADRRREGHPWRTPLSYSCSDLARRSCSSASSGHNGARRRDGTTASTSRPPTRPSPPSFLARAGKRPLPGRTSPRRPSST